MPHAERSMGPPERRRTRSPLFAPLLPPRAAPRRMPRRRRAIGPGTQFLVLAAALLAAASAARCASLTAVQSAAALWEQTALNAAEATLQAIQKQAGGGRRLSLRHVPLESLRVRRRPPHARQRMRLRLHPWVHLHAAWRHAAARCAAAACGRQRRLVHAAHACGACMWRVHAALHPPLPPLHGPAPKRT